uniref:Uncharacterized protein n=1 Tax=Setaria digitata TaxID=48799 RepID=A0A915PDE6_9BILA
MVHQMFASLHRRELYELLPANLKKLGIAELRYLCIKELNGMSEKRIYAILTGRNFAESSESQGEEDEALVVNANIKASKAEIAVADSTTEMTTPSLTILSSISQTIDTGDDFFKNDNLNAPEIHFTPVKSTSLAQIRQKNEDVVQPDFLLEQSFFSRIILPVFLMVYQGFVAKLVQDEICMGLLVWNFKATVVMVEENDSELEEGEVVSGQETSSSSSRSSTAVKDQNCNQYFTIHRNIISDSIFFDSSPASVSKNPENTESSIYTTDNVQEQRKLRMLELELRARAIEALIRRSDKP